MAVLKRSYSGCEVVYGKVVLLGCVYVGKTCLATAIHSDTFRETPKPTVCMDYSSIKLYKPGYDNPVVLQLWDTAGQERFGSLVGLYIRNAHTAMIVYDVTNQSSFSSVSGWVDSVRLEEPKAHCVIVGNKMDDVNKRQISYAQGKALADNNDCLFYETSAKTGENVETMFDDIGRELSWRMTSKLARKNKSTSILHNEKAPRKRCCLST